MIEGLMYAVNCYSYRCNSLCRNFISCLNNKMQKIKNNNKTQSEILEVMPGIEEFNRNSLQNIAEVNQHSKQKHIFQTHQLNINCSWSSSVKSQS